MVERRVEKQAFYAVDAAGKRETLHVLVDIIDASHRGDPDAEIEGVKTIRNSAGKSLNWFGIKEISNS
jgi:hypothetical protein